MITLVHLEEMVKEIKKLEEKIDKLKKQNKKLDQTLQEIKETAEQSNVDCIYRISVIRAILTKAEEE